MAVVCIPLVLLLSHRIGIEPNGRIQSECRYDFWSKP